MGTRRNLRRGGGGGEGRSPKKASHIDNFPGGGEGVYVLNHNKILFVFNSYHI